MNIAVVGLGHIGLPLAAQFAQRGHRVLGCDINSNIVDMVNMGGAYSDEAQLEEWVEKTVKSGLLTAQLTTSDAVRESDIVVIIVPLVVNDKHEIDYRSIDSATGDVARGLKRGTLVLYETTLPVGDTRRRFGPMLAEISGLRLGHDFSLAFSPERVFVGRVFEDLARYPKIVGGVDEQSTARATSFYASALCSSTEIIAVANSETAEFTKLAETTYRDVNIALANEFACSAEVSGVDVLQAIAAANTQPFSHIHRPGIGVGGHCIPVYPHFYAKANPFSSLSQRARVINDEMVSHAVQRISAELPVRLSESTIMIMGYSYRENIKEDSFTVAKRLASEFRRRGARVVVNDPYFTADELAAEGVALYSFDDPVNVDVVVIQAGHSAFADVDFSTIPGLKIIYDGRNAIDSSRTPHGVKYIGLGRVQVPRTAKFEDNQIQGDKNV